MDNFDPSITDKLMKIIDKQNIYIIDQQEEIDKLTIALDKLIGSDINQPQMMASLKLIKGRIECHL